MNAFSSLCNDHPPPSTLIWALNNPINFQSPALNVAFGRQHHRKGERVWTLGSNVGVKFWLSLFLLHQRLEGFLWGLGEADALPEHRHMGAWLGQSLCWRQQPPAPKVSMKQMPRIFQPMTSAAIETRKHLHKWKQQRIWSSKTGFDNYIKLIFCMTL